MIKVGKSFETRFKENDLTTVNLFGITRDPETLDYMVVLQKLKGGSLRSNLRMKKHNPHHKYENLFYVAKSLSVLHKCDLVHGEFHSGNLLLYHKEDMFVFISDLD